MGHLLDNAIVTSGTKPLVRISTQPHERYVTLSVVNNGVGIHAAEHEQVFELFQQLLTANNPEDAGVGLAIVRQAVEKTKGQIGLQSEPGNGSRFSIRLPKG